MKLIKEDDKLYHFQTPDGEFKVVKKGLSKSAEDKIKGIKAMCSGGMVKMSEGGDVLDANARKHIAPHNFALPGGRYPIHDIEHARNALARVSQNGSDKEKEMVRAAVHKKYPSIEEGVQKLANGGEVQDQAQLDTPMANEDSDPINPGQPSVDSRMPASVDSIQADPSSADEMARYNAGVANKSLPIYSVANAVGQYLKPEIDTFSQLGQGISTLGKAAFGSKDSPASASVQQPQTSDDIKSQIAAASPSASGQPQSSFPDYGKQLSGAMSDYANQAQTLAGIQQQGAQNNAQNVDKYLSDGAEYLKTQQAATQQLQDENAQIAKDVQNGHIDPNHFVNNMSTGSKIGTAIGILFSGLGAGAHGTNMAMSVLQDQINKDIDSQKANLGNKSNLLSQNLQRLGNIQAATAATQAQRYSMLQGQIMQQAYQDGSAGALAQAKQSVDLLQAKILPLTAQLGQYSAQRQLLSRTDIDPMSKVMLAGGPGTPLGKQFMAEAQRKNLQQKTLQDYDKAAADATSLRYLGRQSPNQKAFQTDMQANLRGAVPGLRGNQLIEEAKHYAPTRFGGINGDNDIRRGTVWDINKQIPMSYGSGMPQTNQSSMSNDESEE